MVDSHNNDFGRLRLVSHDSFPVWSIVHYLNRLSMTYFKLLTIQRVCEALAEGCEDDELIISEESAKLISNELFTFNDSKSYRVFSNKVENHEQFWSIIKKHHRPVVFRRQGNSFSPLFDISRDDLIINRLTVTSPPDITITGVGTTITDLYYAAEREERLRQDHQNRQIGQTIRNVNDLASAQAMLNNPNINPGMKVYVEAILQGLLERQVELNQEMGLSPMQIDTRI
ncbi:hypothetical protein EXT68_22165 [Pectobacterium parmentieri]|uniref:hypothetical protein n=1 Tax=Pectobacterium parmentieri TaxID=1905730 RepID=UPI00202D7B0A|nr:hypothetical protein [Pectobacterium parmentieri]MCL6358129.1 hypothetical protein [Pectobacterium parmentieri]MCL6382783.1 hypothetical protein [Pectobacterium parmentieri]